MASTIITHLNHINILLIEITFCLRQWIRIAMWLASGLWSEASLLQPEREAGWVIGVSDTSQSGCVLQSLLGHALILPYRS